MMRGTRGLPIARCTEPFPMPSRAAMTAMLRPSTARAWISATCTCAVSLRLLYTAFEGAFDTRMRADGRSTGGAANYFAVESAWR